MAQLFVVRGSFIFHLTEHRLSNSMTKTVHMGVWIIQEDPIREGLKKTFSR